MEPTLQTQLPEWRLKLAIEAALHHWCAQARKSLWEDAVDTLRRWQPIGPENTRPRRLWPCLMHLHLEPQMVEFIQRPE